MVIKDFKLLRREGEEKEEEEKDQEEEQLRQHPSDQFTSTVYRSVIRKEKLWATLKFLPLLRMSFLTFSRILELGLRSTSILYRVDQYQELEQVITHYDLIYLSPHLWKKPPEC